MINFKDIGDLVISLSAFLLLLYTLAKVDSRIYRKLSEIEIKMQLFIERQNTQMDILHEKISRVK